MAKRCGCGTPLDPKWCACPMCGERIETSKAGIPIPLEHPNFDHLVKMIVDGVNESIANGYEDDDFPHYVYEAAMEAVYGKDYWDWHNSRGMIREV